MWVNIDKTNINSHIKSLIKFLICKSKRNVIRHKLKGHIFLIFLIRIKVCGEPLIHACFCHSYQMLKGEK